MAGDFDVECFGSTHVAYILGVATPALLLYSIGVPAAAISLLRRLHRRNKLFEPREKSYSASVYAFLYGGYKRDRYYWEVVIMVRKVLLNLILVVMASASATSTGPDGANDASCIYQRSCRYQPYSNSILNRIESLSLMLAVSVLLLGFFLFEDDMPNAFQMVITVIMVGLILVALLAFFQWGETDEQKDAVPSSFFSFCCILITETPSPTHPMSPNPTHPRPISKIQKTMTPSPGHLALSDQNCRHDNKATPTIWLTFLITEPDSSDVTFAFHLRLITRRNAWSMWSFLPSGRCFSSSEKNPSFAASVSLSKCCVSPILCSIKQGRHHFVAHSRHNPHCN